MPRIPKMGHAHVCSCGAAWVCTRKLSVEDTKECAVGRHSVCDECMERLAEESVSRGRFNRRVAYTTDREGVEQ